MLFDGWPTAVKMVHKESSSHNKQMVIISPSRTFVFLPVACALMPSWPITFYPFQSFKKAVS